jgi:hypothetical protein
MDIVIGRPAGAMRSPRTERIRLPNSNRSAFRFQIDHLGYDDSCCGHLFSFFPWISRACIGSFQSAVDHCTTDRRNLGIGIGSARNTQLSLNPGRQVPDPVPPDCTGAAAGDAAAVTAACCCGGKDHGQLRGPRGSRISAGISRMLDACAAPGRRAMLVCRACQREYERYVKPDSLCYTRPALKF